MNPRAMTLGDPLSIDDARQASRAMARQRRDAENEHERLVTEAADAEHAYRKRLAAEIVKAEGAAPVREAIAKAAAADEARRRDIKAGMVKVQAERLRGLEGERSQLKSLIDWSARLGIDGRENYARAREAA